MGKKIVLVVGATGLVGAEFVKNLQRDQQIDEVRCIVRTPCNALLNSKVNYHVVPFLIWIKVRNCLKVLPMWFVVLEPRLKKQKHESSSRWLIILFLKL